MTTSYLRLDAVIGCKYISAAELGLGQGSQTHIGLIEGVFPPSYHNSVIEQVPVFLCGAVGLGTMCLDYIENQDGSLRSPKIRQGSKNEEKKANIARNISSLSCMFPGKRWFLFFSINKNDSPCFACIVEDTPAWEIALSLGIDFDVISGKAITVSSSEYEKVSSYLTSLFEGKMLLSKGVQNEAHSNVQLGENLLYYGVPGVGKSFAIKNKYALTSDNMERVVFHPDYTYSDFVGQILPNSDQSGHISYPFIPGPFTRLLKKANEKENSANHFYLVIEEINRGNAPAIFGDIFQLLDRSENGESEYEISNPEIAKKVYGDENAKVKLPSNLSIIATMNSADQNVFTLDTAFKRRWNMVNVPINLDACSFGKKKICGSDVTWRMFVKVINKAIVGEHDDKAISSSDYRIGPFFMRESELDNEGLFASKVLMYLWNDAFKYRQDEVFNDYKTLDGVLADFPEKKFGVFKEDLVKEMIIHEDEAEESEKDEENSDGESFIAIKNEQLLEALKKALDEWQPDLSYDITKQYLAIHHASKKNCFANLRNRDGNAICLSVLDPRDNKNDNLPDDVVCVETYGPVCYQFLLNNESDIERAVELVQISFAKAN